MIARMFQFIFGVLAAIIRPIWHEFVDMVRFLSFGRQPNNQTPRKVYTASLRRITTVVGIASALFLTLGTFFGYKCWDWGVLIVFLIWALPTAVLLFAVSPFGIALYAIPGEPVEAPRKYVRFATGIIAGGLSFALLLMVTAIQNNPRLIPLFLLTALVLGAVAAFTHRIASMVVAAAIVILLLTLVAFTLPKTTTVIGQRFSDNTIATALDNLGRKAPAVSSSVFPSREETPAYPSETPAKRAMIVISREEGLRGITVPAGAVAVTGWTPPVGTIITVEAEHPYQIIIGGDGLPETRKDGPAGKWKWRANGNPLGPIKVSMVQTGLLKIY